MRCASLKDAGLFKKALLSFFGIGFVRGGGTLTSAAVCLLFYLSPWALLPLAVLAFVGLFLCPKEPHDPRWVTTDEVAGQCVALLPLVLLKTNFWGIVVAFVLFRFFDVVKPPPIKALQRFANPWGVYIDDVVAGGFAAALTCAFILLLR